MADEKKDRRDFINPHFRDLCNAIRNLNLALLELKRGQLVAKLPLFESIEVRLMEISKEASLLALRIGRVVEAEGGDVQMEKMRQEVYLMRSQLNNTELVKELNESLLYSNPMAQAFADFVQESKAELARK